MVEYYTYKKKVPIRKGWHIDFRRGKGYYLAPNKVVPKPPAPVVVDLAPVQNVLVVASEPEVVLEHTPWWYQVWITADLGYREWYTAEFFASALQQKRKLSVWCDCRASPDGTPPQVALAFVEQVKALGFPDCEFAGQCENPDEFNRAYKAGAKKMVGKIDGITAEQRQLVGTGKVLLTHETYYNVQPDLKPDWMNCNKGIGSNCVACYESVREGAVYTPLTTQIKNGWFIKGRDSLYTEGCMVADLNAL